MAHGAWGWGFWWCIPLLFGSAWLVLFWLLSWRRRRFGGWGGWRGGPGRPDAIQALRLRFARGEIDEDEYQRRRSVLQADRL